MEKNVVKCPNCGANATNHTNCEYCGSLLVRFADKGIDVDNTIYHNKNNIFPGLIEELQKNLQIQRIHSEDNALIQTLIFWINKDGEGQGIFVQSDETPNSCNSLTISLDFTQKYEYDNSEVDSQFSRFTRLDSFPLFKPHYVQSEEEYIRTFDVNFGQDAEGAALLITEILIKVYGLSVSETLKIFTGTEDEIDAKADEWYHSFGFNTEDDTEDDIKPLSGWQKILLVVTLILGGVDSYYIFSQGKDLFLIGMLFLSIVIVPTLTAFIPYNYEAAIERGDAKINPRSKWITIILFIISLFVFTQIYSDIDNKEDVGNRAETEQLQTENTDSDEGEYSEKESRKDKISKEAYEDGIYDAYRTGSVETTQDLIRNGYSKEHIRGLQKSQGELNYKDRYGEPKNSEEEALQKLYGEKFAEGFMNTMFKN